MSFQNISEIVIKSEFLFRTRLLFGISVFWFPLSTLSDGLNTLLLRERILTLLPTNNIATILGLLSFSGLLVGMLVMPIAGAWSDRLRLEHGRIRVIGLGTILTLLALFLFASMPNFIGLIFSYLFIQIAASIAQAAQQGLLSDLGESSDLNSKASGIKNFLEIGAAVVGFILLGQLLSRGQVSVAILLIAALLVVAFLFTVILVREHPVPLAKTPTRNPFHIDLRQHRDFVWLVLSRFFFLLGTYAIGRFLLFFVAQRLSLEPQQVSGHASVLLAGLALVTIVAAPLSGWLADHVGCKPLMLAGALLSAIGAFLMVWSEHIWHIVLFGSLLSLGSAAFISANCSMTTDLTPQEEAARFSGLANIGAAGAAAAAGLFGPLVDVFNQTSMEIGYIVLFVACALAFVVSAVSLYAVHPLELPGIENVPIEQQ